MASRTASINSVTERVKALDISSQNQNYDPTASKPVKQSSSKLQSKYAPNSATSSNSKLPLLQMAMQNSQESPSGDATVRPGSGSAMTKPLPGRTVTEPNLAEQAKKSKGATLDVGRYDGGLEEGVDTTPIPVMDEETARVLALDSSLSGQTREWNLTHFEIGRPLGKGKFGRVYMVRTKNPPHYHIALKCLHKNEIIQNRVEVQIRREIEIQQNLRHPNVLRLFGYFHDERRIFLMIEFAAKGELYKQLQKLGSFSEKRSSRYIDQMTDALAYLHGKHVMHRDIKPENLLIGLDGELKIGDFGWSVHAPGNKRDTLCGTPDYLPPEIVEGKSYDCRVDHWALGVLTYEFICGAPPFEDPNGRSATYKRIARVQYAIPDYVSQDARDFITRLLIYSPERRMSLDVATRHPWLVKYRRASHAT